MGQMEETRNNLTDKLTTLEQKVAGTVESVNETVSTVTETVESVKESVEDTVATVTDTVQSTVESVSDAVGNTVDSVASFLDISTWAEKRPWLMMGGSVLLGYLAGRLLTPRRPEEAAPTYAATPRQEAPSRREEAAEEAGGGVLGKLTEQFGPEIDKLKGLAVGTLMGVARDMVSQFVPQAIKREVTDVINGFTSNLGGKVIDRPIVPEAPERKEPESRPQEAAGPEPHEAVPEPRGMSHRPERAGRGKR
jgi:hypothetical protein